MSKEQTPIEELIEQIKLVHGSVPLEDDYFKRMVEKEQKHIRAKVLEALEPIIQECKKVIDSPNHLESTKGFASIIWYELEQSKQK